MKVIKIWWKWKKGWGKAHALYERIIFRHNWCCLFTSLAYISKYQYNWVWRLWLSQLHVWIYLVWRWQGCCWTFYNVQDSPPQQRITHLKMSIVPRLRNTAIFSSPNSQRPFSIIVLSTFSWKSLKVFLLILGWECKSFFWPIGSSVESPLPTSIFSLCTYLFAFCSLATRAFLLCCTYCVSIWDLTLLLSECSPS